MAWIVTAVLCVGCSPVYGSSWGTVTLDGAFDYETSQVAASWWPDPNGGIGVIAMTDSAVSEDTENNYAIGPCVTFSLTEAYRALLATVLPSVPVPDGVQIGMVGRLGMTWDINDDADLSFIGATGVLILPERTICPTIWAEYIVPEGSADEDREVRAMFGVMVRLGKD